MKHKICVVFRHSVFLQRISLEKEILSGGSQAGNVSQSRSMRKAATGGRRQMRGSGVIYAYIYTFVFIYIYIYIVCMCIYIYIVCIYIYTEREREISLYSIS